MFTQKVVGSSSGFSHHIPLVWQTRNPNWLRHCVSKFCCVFVGELSVVLIQRKI